MKKTHLIILILIVVFIINITATYTLLFHRYNSSVVDNNLISFNVPNNYYLKNSINENNNKFKMYSNDNESSIDLIILEQIPSNKTNYSIEKMSNSIMYQLEKNIDKYQVEKTEKNNNNIEIKYIYKNEIINANFTYNTSNIIIVLYTTSNKYYDENMYNNLLDSIKVKNEK